MVPVVAGVAVAEEEGRGDDAEEPHLEEQGVPLEPEERLAVVEEGEVEVPHDEERRLVEEPWTKMRRGLDWKIFNLLYLFWCLECHQERCNLTYLDQLEGNGNGLRGSASAVTSCLAASPI